MITRKGRKLTAEWYMQAEANLRKWGPRSLETMAVVLGEEYGELCRAILEKNYGDGTRDAIIAELKDTAAVCIQMANVLAEDSSHE